MPIWKVLVCDIKAGHIFVKAETREDALSVAKDIHPEDLEAHLNQGSHDIYVSQEPSDAVPQEWLESEPFGAAAGETCEKIILTESPVSSRGVDRYHDDN